MPLRWSLRFVGLAIYKDVAPMVLDAWMSFAPLPLGGFALLRGITAWSEEIDSTVPRY